MKFTYKINYKTNAPASEPFSWKKLNPVVRVTNYFIFFLATGIWYGCDKKLDLVSQQNITDATFWKSANDFKLAANRLYQDLDRFGFEDTESDIAFNVPNSVSNGNLLLSETSSTWTNSYNSIRSANNILQKGNSSTDAAIKKYVAEAKFFRAWYYWKLARLYGGVPLIATVLDTDDEELFA